MTVAAVGEIDNRIGDELHLTGSERTNAADAFFVAQVSERPDDEGAAVLAVTAGVLETTGDRQPVPTPSTITQLWFSSAPDIQTR